MPEPVISEISTLAVNTDRTIRLFDGSSLSTINGNITLTAHNAGDADGALRGVTLVNASITTSGTGNIAVTGEATDQGSDLNWHIGISLQNASGITSTATGADAGTITLNGIGGDGAEFNSGVLLSTDTLISSVDGDVMIIGRGGNGTGEKNYGVDIDPGASIQSTGTTTAAAKISIDGTAGSGTQNNQGVVVAGAALSTVMGDLSITGQGAASSGAFNHGVIINADSLLESLGTGLDAATITVDGIGGAGTDWNVGTAFSGGAALRSIDGDVTFIGRGGAGTGASNRGVNMNDFNDIRSTGTGVSAAKISIVGIGGSGTNSSGGGVLAGDASAIESHDGAIFISGNSGMDTTEFLNGGIWVGVNVRSLGSASIEISGTASGSTSTSLNRGVDIAGNGTEVVSVSGAITINGSGAQGSGDSNHGVRIHDQSMVASTTGHVTFNGTAGTGNSHGIDLQGNDTSAAQVRVTGAGQIALLATGNQQADALHIGPHVQVGSPTQLENVNLLSDSIDIDPTAILQSSGALNIEPLTANTSIGLGGADGTLNLDDAELATFQDGFSFIQIGSPDAGHVALDTVTLPADSQITGAKISAGAAGTDVTAPLVILLGGLEPGQIGDSTGPKRRPGILNVDGHASLGENSPLHIAVAGTTAGDGDGFHSAVHSSGIVGIGSNVQLKTYWSPTWTPTPGDELTIVQRNSAGGGTFVDLPEGAVLPDFFNATISYAGGDGNDITLTLPAVLPAPTVVNLADLGNNGVTIFGADAGDQAGHSVHSAGDVNGDGYDDFLIGANKADSVNNQRVGSGEAYLIYGGPNLPRTFDPALLGSAGVVIYGADANDVTAHVVDSADVNRDGYSDLIIGAHSSDGAGNATPSAGGAYIIYGGPSLPQLIDLQNLGSGGVTIHGADDSDLAGNPVAAVGDVNDDGFPDFAVGAIWADSVNNSRDRAGEAYIIFGGDTLPTIIDLANPGTLAVTVFGANAADEFGVSIDGLGDINGDNIDDLIIGARYADAGSVQNRRVGETYIIYGRQSFAGTLDLASGGADIVIHGIDTDDFSGWPSGGGGDVNGDGFNDLIIGSAYAGAFGNSRIQAGESYVIFGGPVLPSLIELNNPDVVGMSIFGAAARDFSGWSAQIVGDLNDDGFDDIAIGAREVGLDGAVDNVGKTYIIFGKSVLPPTVDLANPGGADVVLVGTDSVDEAGVMVRGAGDVNGDGIDDLVIGARFADSVDNTRTNAGEAYLVFGGNLFWEDLLPEVTGPVGTINDTTPTLTWQPVPHADSYEVWLQLTGGSNNPVLNPTVTTASYDVPDDLHIGRYRTWVRANLADGSKTNWATGVFDISLPVALHDVPFFGTDRRPTFTWDPLMPSGGTRIYISNITTRENGIVDAIVPDGQYTFFDDLSFGLYRIWIRAVGQGNYQAEWSESKDYFLGPQPQTPMGATLETQPQFSWTAIPGAASFQVYVVGPGGVLINQSGITGTTFTPSTALPNADFRWWLRGFTADGNVGPWSQPVEFSTGGRTRVTSHSGTIAGNIPEFHWPTVPTTTSYEVYVSKTGTPGPLYRKAGLTTTSYPSLPLENGDYRVWIRTTLGDGSSVWGRGVAFTVNVVTNGPQLSAASPIGPGFNPRPQFLWTPTADAFASYDVYLHDGTNAGLQTGLDPIWTPNVDLAAGEWTWSVRGVGFDGTPGPWSLPASFNTSGRTTLLTPAASTSDTTPMFTWQPVTGAVRYVLQVDNLTTGVSKVIRENNLTAESFTPTSSLATGTYRAWVRAISSTSTGPWSVPFDFVITEAAIEDSSESPTALLTVLLLLPQESATAKAATVDAQHSAFAATEDTARAKSSRATRVATAVSAVMHDESAIDDQFAKTDDWFGFN